jgi:hypothetical protein
MQHNLISAQEKRDQQVKKPPILDKDKAQELAGGMLTYINEQIKKEKGQQIGITVDYVLHFMGTEYQGKILALKDEADGKIEKSPTFEEMINIVIDTLKSKGYAVERIGNNTIDISWK